MFNEREITAHLLQTYGFDNPLFGRKPEVNILSKEPIKAIINYENGEELEITNENFKYWELTYSNESHPKNITTYANLLKNARDLLKDQIKALVLLKMPTLSRADDFQKSMQEKMKTQKKFEHLYQNVVKKCKSYTSEKRHIFNAEISISIPGHKLMEDKKSIVKEIFKQYRDILNEFVPEQTLYYKEYLDDKLIFKIQTNEKGTKFPIKNLINLSRLLKPQAEIIQIQINVSYWEIKETAPRYGRYFGETIKSRYMSRTYCSKKNSPIIGFEKTHSSNRVYERTWLKKLDDVKQKLNLPELINLEDYQNFQKYLEDVYQNENAIKTLTPKQTKRFEKFIRKLKIYKTITKSDQFSNAVLYNAEKHRKNQYIFTHKDFLEFIIQNDYIKNFEERINNRGKLNNFNHLYGKFNKLERQYKEIIEHKDITVKKLNSLYTVPNKIKEQLKECKTDQEQIKFLIELNKKDKLW